MEEDIKILEDGLKNGTIYVNCGNSIDKAIENLIKGYRILEFENQALQNTKDTCPNMATSGIRCDIKSNYIPKSKIKKFILDPMKEEHDKAINEFMKKGIPQCISAGDVAQELGYFIGKIEELLKGE